MSFEKRLADLYQDCTLFDGNGKFLMMLNPQLVMNQKLTIDEINELKTLHLIRIKLFERMEKTTDKHQLNISTHLLENLEFALQRAWHFKEDRLLHSWWFQAPYCTCPKNENWEHWGIKRIINPNCILHRKE
jgi:hypothetical protein